ncbi:MAG: hypothetical protein AB7F91_07350 [Parvularculaceae bacterium]|nr:hypothetical protein [Parvularculaceae bacterium]
MLRFTMIMLCFVLAAAAAGRYQAEAAVRDTRIELRRLDQAKERELSSIQLLKAEVAYLENPERLSGIAGNMTSLEPLSGAQLMTAEDFKLAFGAGGKNGQARANGDGQPVEVADLGVAGAH